MLLAFERAERESDPERRRALLTFVVVGGGPTGVELAGAIGEIACKVMARDFRTIDTRDARTILVEAGPRILPTFPADLSEKAERSLERLCVEVRTGQAVTRMEDGVVLARRRPDRGRRPCCGRPASSPRRSRAPSACRWTAPGA